MHNKSNIKIKNKAIVTILAVAVMTGLAYGGYKLYKPSGSDGDNKTKVEQQNQKQTDTLSDEQEKILEMLESQGIDTSGMRDPKKTEGGATVLGDALPVEEFRTLAEAEEHFGYYLGYHNRLDSLTEYELVRIFLINHEFLQANFDNQDATKSLTVKLSLKKTAKELSEVYKDYPYDSEVEIEGVTVNISGESKEKLNLAYFSVPNGKSYSIHTVAGLTPDEMTELLTELVSNLKIMDDWRD